MRQTPPTDASPNSDGQASAALHRMLPEMSRAEFTAMDRDMMMIANDPSVPPLPPLGPVTPFRAKPEKPRVGTKIVRGLRRLGSKLSHFRAG